jgi:hypothetical protein
MTEQQRYEVVAVEPGFELRRYPEHVVAEVEVDASFESAGNQAFRPLVSYIGRGGIAMTAPVVQTQDADLDTALTTMTEAGDGRYTVAFVMPDGSRLDELPPPSDPRVRMRAVPEQLAAAARFSGRWSASSYRTQVERLLVGVAAAGYEIAGAPRYARFDPPWKPWFARHNEVVVPVRRA